MESKIERRDGQFTSVVSAGGQAASTGKVLWQRETREKDKSRTEFGLSLIQAKARNTLITMEDYLPKSPAWTTAYKNIKTRTRWLTDRPPRQFSNLLGQEGAIANEYFRAWTGLQLKWRIEEEARGTYPALALDFMEPMRPVVDRAVSEIITNETLCGSDFSIQHDGVCRLNPELARHVAQLALKHYVEVSDTEWLKLA